MSTATQRRTQEAQPPPKELRQIRIYVDRETDLICIKPRGTIEACARDEILAFMKAHRGLLAPIIVEEAVAICERHGWRLTKWEDGLPFTTPTVSGVDKIATMEKQT